MTDLSFAPLLAEHQVGTIHPVPLAGGTSPVTCTCGQVVVSEAAHPAHQDAVLRAEVARWLGSDEAAEVIGRGLLADYDSQYDTSHLEWTEFEDQARALLAALTTHLTGDTR